MPVYQDLVDFDDMFNKLSEPPIIINTIKNDSEDLREQIREVILSRFTTDMVSLIPTCLCKAKKGFQTFFSPKDRLCTKCGTYVKSAVEDDLEPIVWFTSPKDAPPIIHPMIWTMLRERFSKSRFNLVQWICDTSYRPRATQPKVVGRLVEAGIQRGYKYFYENFDMIMEFLFSLKEFRLTKKGRVDYLQLLIERDRHKLFCRAIPFPNKTLLIIEKTNVGVYIDPIVINAMNAIEMLVSIDQDFYEQNPRIKTNRMIKAIDALSSYYVTYFKNNLSVKTGMLRRHIFGTRANFSCRAVISSITGPHRADEIWLPWGIGLTVYRMHLLNKLSKLGMDHNSSVGLLLGHINKWHPLLDKLLNELITEAAPLELAVLLNRN